MALRLALHPSSSGVSSSESKWTRRPRSSPLHLQLPRSSRFHLCRPQPQPHPRACPPLPQRQYCHRASHGQSCPSTRPSARRRAPRTASWKAPARAQRGSAFVMLTPLGSSRPFECRLSWLADTGCCAIWTPAQCPHTGGPNCAMCGLSTRHHAGRSSSTPSVVLSRQLSRAMSGNGSRSARGRCLRATSPQPLVALVPA